MLDFDCVIIEFDIFESKNKSHLKPKVHNKSNPRGYTQKNQIGLIQVNNTKPLTNLSIFKKLKLISPLPEITSFKPI